MAFPTVNVNDMVTRVRKRCDLETNDDTKSIASDAEIVEYLNDAARELYELITQRAGDAWAGETATLTSAGSYALPADFYRLLAVFYTPPGSSIQYPLRPFTLLEARGTRSADQPAYRIRSGNLVFDPPTFTGSVTIVYVPTAAVLTAGGTFASVDGWDVYLIEHAAMSVRRKMEYPNLRDYEAALERATARVVRAACRIAPDTGTTGIGDVRWQPDSQFYND